ncbi:MAG TPA: cytochrome c biogenesis protein CcsA [Candidatus Angelobacter sp.]|nr:cytochrome c biogenesis protein CcsA [Candidatus Angelobacter sp.]
MKSKLYPFFVGLVFVLLSYGTYQGLIGAPTEETMGDAQRIFYYHVPAATVAYTLFFVNFLASIIVLWKRSATADAWALTAAEVGVVFATVVLITGPIWARYAWGAWWVWDMRLTTFLILWLLYVSYLTLRRSSEGGSASVLASALAIFAFLDVPFSYMANQWFRTNHPQRVIGTGNLDPRMGYALMANMIAFLAFGALIAWFRYELEVTERKISAIHVQRAARGVLAGLALPALFLFQAPQHASPTTYMYSAYIAAWVIYIGYLLFLTRKVAKLKREEQELTRVG